MDIIIKSFPDCPCPVCGRDLWAQVGLAAWQCQTCWPVEKYPPGYRAKSQSQREILNRVAKRQDFKEFNRRFLLAIHPYPPMVAKQLLRECHEDIVLLGWEHTQNKWMRFVELPKEGACPVCGSTDWWDRPASELGGRSERLCGRCHPKPGEKEEKSPVDLSYFSVEVGEKILAVWIQEGKPAIPLSQGVRCVDLEKFLSWPTNSEHVKTVKDWADRHQLEAMGERI